MNDGREHGPAGNLWCVERVNTSDSEGLAGPLTEDANRRHRRSHSRCTALISLSDPSGTIGR